MLNTKQEIWKPLKGFEGLYAVSSRGQIKNKLSILKPYINNSGYKCIDLAKAGIRSKKLVHRLVMLTFKPEGEKRQVNHIDGVKLNNDISNLEWVTPAENLQHARATGLLIYNKPTKGKKLKDSSSQYFGVCYDRNRGKWASKVVRDWKIYYQRRFLTEVEAAKHYNWILDELGITDMPKNEV